MIISDYSYYYSYYCYYYSQPQGAMGRSGCLCPSGTLNPALFLLLLQHWHYSHYTSVASTLPLNFR